MPRLRREALCYGLAADFVPLRPPYVPGNGVAGQVIAAGEGVDRRWIGRRVVAHTGGTGGGGYAEQALVPAAALVPVPAGLGLPAAAALLHDGATALGLADSTGIRPGEWVLVAGAGRIQPVTGQTFPLDQAAAAHTAIETRSVTGKTLLLTG